MLPADDLAVLRRWADQRVPEHVRDEVRMELDVSDRAVTIVECRPPGGSPSTTSRSVRNRLFLHGH